MIRLGEITQSSIREKQQDFDVTIGRKVFAVLHGVYGNSFLSMYTTGALDGNGVDKGVKFAMRQWARDLSKFNEDIVVDAIEKAKAMPQYVTFAPKLPELLAICRALTPRTTALQVALHPQKLAEIAHAPVAKLGDGRDWARVIVARAEAGNQVSHRALADAKKTLNIGFSLMRDDENSETMQQR